MTPESNCLLFYVADVPASVRFYTVLLDALPIESSPGFAMFILPPGLALGLWNKDQVQPPPIEAGGGCELGLKVRKTADVDAAYANWRDKNVTIAQPPIDLEFGRSFVALDPDGHRLRVYAMTEEQA